MVLKTKENHYMTDSMAKNWLTLKSKLNISSKKINKKINFEEFNITIE